MISYEKCLVLKELATTLIETYHYIANNPRISVGILDGEYDTMRNGYMAVFYPKGNCYIYDSTDNIYQKPLMSIRKWQLGMYTLCKTLHDGYITCNFSDNLLAEVDNYFTNTHGAKVTHNLPSILKYCNASEDAFNSTVFQLSTLYDDEDIETLLIYSFLRDMLEGSGMSITISSTTLEDSVEKIIDGLELLKCQLEKMKKSI